MQLIDQWANEPGNIKALHLPKGTKWGTPAEVRPAVGSSSLLISCCGRWEGKLQSVVGILT